MDKIIEKKINSYNYELRIENNLSSWLRDMILIMSVVIACIGFLNQEKVLFKPLTLISLALLCISSILIGVFVTSSLIKRLKFYRSVNKIDKNNFTKYYIFVSIFVLLGLFGLCTVILLYVR